MLRRNHVQQHRSGRFRPYLLMDNAIRTNQGHKGERNLKSMGFQPKPRADYKQRNDGYMMEQWEHAMPLLTHMNYGFDEQSNDTKHLELANYMPRRGKGLPPWFRGRDTYSPLYAEQGRYEYQRYRMVARLPKEYKERFMLCAADLRKAIDDEQPLAVLHALYQLIIEHYNPQHVHFQIAIEGLTKMGEISRARDVWRMMERQMTWPDDKCIAAYLELCAVAGKKEWAFECWNRYCSEKRFLSNGEVDPKPVSRTPFTLNRDELLHLPKWKKFFDHDPNNDVADRNRFNTTRNLYLQMARVMLADGQFDLFGKYFSDLETALFDTPTPVPEPPETVAIATPQWRPTHEQDNITSANPFRMDPETAKQALGPDSVRVSTMGPRFFTNKQFLLHAAATILDDLTTLATDEARAGLPAGLTDTADAFADELCERVLAKLGNELASLDMTSFTVSAIRAAAVLKPSTTGEDALAMANKIQSRKVDAVRAVEEDSSAVAEAHHPAVYLEVLRAYNRRATADLESQQLDARGTIASATQVITEMASLPTFEWAADHHFEIVALLVRCGTMAANAYFVKNVLRQFKWDTRFAYQLYQEYRRSDDVELWAELTKRMLVWTARYDVELDEVTKRAIEDDYETIQVQVRTYTEVVNFAFRSQEERRMASDPSTAMPNPVMDYVSHALPFPDRDTGALDEFGELGQNRKPLVQGRVNRAPFFEASMPSEAMKEYTSQLKEKTDPMDPLKLPTPWATKHKEHARGKHPSYDQVYAGPMPQIFPTQRNFRRQTRWDFKEIENQSKYKFSGPF